MPGWPGFCSAQLALRAVDASSEEARLWAVRPANLSEAEDRLRPAAVELATGAAFCWAAILDSSFGGLPAVPEPEPWLEVLLERGL